FRLLPRRPRPPVWLGRFVEEPGQQQDELGSEPKRPFGRLLSSLLVVSLCGCGFQILKAFHPAFRFPMVFSAVAWIIAAFVIVVHRPSTTPKSLLVLYLSILISDAINLIDVATKLKQTDILTFLTILMALGAIAIILNMPLRNPLLSKEGISPVFGPPTAILRSPEDSLTLWQYMTVSWMSPLIVLGNQRQLNDEDVWSLSYEFQHRMLHDRFRELTGSVLKRLLVANGVDLVIISLLSIIELIANFSDPIFLQKILQTMEDPRAPKRAAFSYAAIALLIRLLASQSAVFSLWYGRRAYERSRGEMITMIYEKTLSRKVVAINVKPANDIIEPVSNDNLKETVPIWKKAVEFFRRPLSRKVKKTQKNDEVASMGKIMNLMRFDAYEVAQRYTIPQYY
ncbi:ABC bile acid, partial [Phlyctema vagabunda]